MLRWRHEYTHHPARLARRAATTRLGAQRAGLETVCQRRCARGDARSRQPVAQARPRAGGGGVAPPSGAGTAAQAQRRATRPPPRAPRSWRRSVRLSRPGVDLPAGRRGDATPVWCHSRTIRPTSTGCCRPCGTASSVQRPASSAPSRGPPNATRPRLPPGGRSAGPPWKKSGRRRTDPRLGRPVRLLPAAQGRAHLGAARAEAETPVRPVPLTPDHLAAIGGLTPTGRLFLQTHGRLFLQTHGRLFLQTHGRLFLQTHAQAYHSPAVVRFLRVLLREVRGKVLVIWDGAPIHRGQPINDFLARGAATRRHLEQGPGYAPKLNPDEGIWNDRKRGELGNRSCPCPDLLA